MLNRKCYQVSKTEMELHMVNMIYAALLMRVQTEKTTSAKLYIYNEVGTRDLYIDKAHMARDIFRFAAFCINFGYHYYL